MYTHFQHGVLAGCDGGGERGKGSSGFFFEVRHWWSPTEGIVIGFDGWNYRKFTNELRLNVLEES